MSEEQISLQEIDIAPNGQAPRQAMLSIDYGQNRLLPAIGNPLEILPDALVGPGLTTNRRHRR